MIAFPWTLQRYICREMGKTFLLTAIALTGVLGLGGGVLNMMKMGEMTPAQFLSVVGLVIPLSAALTLPIAALFSAASTYGRLSADNEFVACRSGGINIHVLLLPTLALSLVSAVGTFAFVNFVIPGMFRNLTELVRADLGSIVQQRLNRPRGITLGGKYRIHAHSAHVDPQNPNRIGMQGVTFVEVDGADWVRIGTMEQIILEFDKKRKRIAAELVGLSYYDRRANQFFEEASQSLSHENLPDLLEPEIKFLNIGELFYYLLKPDEWHEVRDALDRLRIEMGRHAACEALWRDWKDGHALILEDDQVRYDIASEMGGIVPGGTGIELAKVTVEQRNNARMALITAERAVLEVTRGKTLDDVAIKIQLHEVSLSDSDNVTVELARKELGRIRVSRSVLNHVKTLSSAELLKIEVADSPSVKHRRGAARDAWDDTARRIVAAIHQRFAFSMSVFVLVILAAALAIIFRGSHVLVAFGISFVPALFVIVAIASGRLIAHNPNSHGWGLVVMWSSIALVAVVDWWTLTRVLRR